ncbi:esterase-like activity of phytase family protein [Nocardioides daphniae]|uniref:Bacterial Ig-like domain-containing protein n=1 Tax=Nocardioides daphniae TaxID=402297 RepID=A0A4P7U909_9ACTN|nr:esterase-like activity of phytase family protein [Nocardioides daphniae]QCC76582.1 hypothetical protein E2C04_03990 [Nocardioides daphniae]GGD14294.1 hypothetical protein GCM10007231_11600 [Nocardioides daphniae]
MALTTALAAALVTGLLVGGPTAAGQEPEPPSAAQTWPGGRTASAVDVAGELGTDVSGLSFRAGGSAAADVLWGVDDRAGLVHRLVQSSGKWRPDQAGGWRAGKTFTFPDGRVPDAEGIVVSGDDAWVSTERDSTGTSRLSILRVPLGGSSAALGPTTEWSLAREFPALGANSGLEALDLVPDASLVAHGFVDEARGTTYDPAAYPGKVGGGVFFVAAEAASLKGQVRGYVLRADGSVVRVATVANPLGLVQALEWDADAGLLWIVCDDACDGRTATARLRSGRFVVSATYARAAGLPNYNFEGFTVAPRARCSGGVRPVFWSNDANDRSHAIWAGTLPCPAAPAPDPGPDPGKVATRLTATVAPTQAGQRVRVVVGATAVGATPTGQVQVSVGSRVRTGTLADGAATVWMGAFTSPGVRPVTVSYAGNDGTYAAESTARLTVGRAATRLRPVVRRVAVNRGKRARLSARITANGLPTPGQVRVRVKGRLVKATVRRTDGRLVVRTPALRARGRVTVTVRYRGSAATAPASATFVVRVR